MKYQVRRILGAGRAAFFGIAILAFSLQTPAFAQDAYHQWVVDMLANDYNITGGTFVLGTSEGSVLNAAAWISDNQGASSAAVMTVDPSEEVPFTLYNHYSHRGVTVNWYDALTRFVDIAPVENGDVALLVLLARGTNPGGGVASVELVFDMNVAPYTRALSTEQLLQPEWTQILIPFQMPFSLAAGGGNFGFNYGLKEIDMDVAAPIVLNFKDKYTLEGLQALIDNMGQAPLMANFSADAVRGVPPFEVTFDAANSTSPGTITSYAWNFGDGSTGSGQTVTHTFASFGIFTVELTVSDDRGGQASSTRQIIVFDGRGLPESPLEIPFTSTPPTVDGTIEAAWNDAVTVTLDNVVADFPPIDAADFAATAHVMWDTQRLYALYEVTDQSKYNTSSATWQDDSVELYVDGGNEKTGSYDANDGQYELGWNATELTGTAVEQNKATGVEFAAVDVSGGYVVEISVPWSSLNVEVVPGDVIGLDFMANDDDTGGDARQTKLSWYNLLDDAWTRLDGAGTAQLVGGEGAVTAAAFDVSVSEFLTDVPVTFDATRSISPAAIVSYEWDFGDGDTGEGVTVTHSYSTVGSYIVTLTITDANGATDTATRGINVIDGVGRPDKPFRIPLAPSTPVIDGVLDAAWAEAGTVVGSNVPTGEPLSGPDDLAARAYAMWNDAGLYVFVDVTDDELYGNESADTWRDDAVEVFLDGNNAKVERAYDSNDGQFTVGLNDTELTGAKGRPDMGDGVQFASNPTANGYAVEMAVPWASLELNPVVGALIGFEFQVNDDDDGGDRDSKLTWFDATDNAWQWAHVFGTAMLVETVDVAVDEADELPDGFAIESVYPNPFNPSTTALVSVREVGIYELRVYNVLGQLVKRMQVNVQMPGSVEIGLDFSDRASGVYFLTLENKTTGRIATARAMLVK
ncbi:MAG TPA: sugar-binding protein [Rhodothermales bacterium]